MQRPLPCSLALGLASVLALGVSLAAAAQAPTPPAESPAPGRLVVVYRGGAVPSGADQLAAAAGARAVRHLPLFGISALAVVGDADDEDAAIRRLRADPRVRAVLHDRNVTAHQALFTVKPPLATLPLRQLGGTPFVPAGPPFVEPPSTDTLYDSPQGWAVLASGGYGDGLPNAAGITDSIGPWTTTLGAGVRIAVLDSGLDRTHPDLAPNLALNLTEVNQDPSTGQPSACDDGSPQDQQGHGTWTASLAAGAVGGGNVLGVAPQATLLNIKVLERLPAAAGPSLIAQCEAGQAGGLLSWVLQGIADAVANHANVISLSLGTLIDTTTGDGAGWQAAFDQATYAATQAGVVVVAALGNDGLDLSPSGPNARYLELPAQARGVLAVVASTNPACAEDLATGADCAAGPITRPYYSDYGVPGALAAPGGSYPEGTATGVSGFVMGACSSGLANTTDGLPPSADSTDPAPAGHSFGCFGLGHLAYVQAMGTSASAALVAGAAALLFAAHTNWSAGQVIAALRATGVQLGNMTEPSLNLPAALAFDTPAAVATVPLDY